MTTVKDNKQNKAVEKKPLSKQQQAAVDGVNTKTKNDNSHIAKQRAARLSQHESKAQQENS